MPIASLLRSFGLDVWIYRGADWYVPDPNGPHVAHEAWTVQFQPRVMTRIEDLTDNVAKIVGVSDDHELRTVPRSPLSAITGVNSLCALCCLAARPSGLPGRQAARFSR